MLDDTEYSKSPDVYAAMMKVAPFESHDNDPAYDPKAYYQKNHFLRWTFNPSTWNIKIFVRELHAMVDPEAAQSGVTGHLFGSRLEIRNCAEGCPPVEAIRIALLKYLQSS